jgi:hypothetical protein
MWKGWRASPGFGFQIEDRKVSGVPVGPAAPRWDGRPAIRALEYSRLTLARVRPALFGYQFVVTASRQWERLMGSKPKVVGVMPAYNAAKTLHDLRRSSAPDGGSGDPGRRRQQGKLRGSPKARPRSCSSTTKNCRYAPTRRPVTARRSRPALTSS